MKLVDINPEDAQGTVINVRLIVQGKQIRAVLPHLPVNQLVTSGFQLTITLNDRWRPKETCWTFIPVEPLLDLVSMQDMMDGSTAADSSPTRSASTTVLTPLTPTESISTMSRQSTPTQHVEMATSFTSNQNGTETVKIVDVDFKSPMAKQALDHYRGECIPCSFHAFRVDGCRRGEACPFCHLCNAPEARARRRQIKKEAIESKITSTTRIEGPM